MLLRAAVLRSLKLPRPCRQATWVALRAFSAPVQGGAAAAEPPAQYGDRAAGIAPLPHASGEPISVDAPPTVAWSPDNVNSVRLIGTVLTQPTLYHTAANQTVANVVLGLRPRYGRSSMSQSVALESWGYTSLQLAQHVRQGMQIQVDGQLKESVWADRTTGEERRRVKVVVERVYIVAPPEHAQQHAPTEPGQPAAAEQPAKAPAEKAPPTLTPTMRFSHALFQDQGKTLQEVAAERGIKLSTVVDHVLKAAGFGLPLDWKRAASELQLGPRDSPWLTAEEVWTAISATHAEQFGVPADDPSARLMDITLRRVREQLEAGAGTMAKLGAQESMAGSAWVTYGAIKLVTVMRLQGVDWDSVITEPPMVLPAAGAAVAAPPPPF